MPLAAAPVLELLRGHGVGLLTGVPCSSLSGLMALAAREPLPRGGGSPSAGSVPSLPWVAAACEGEAVALAAGSGLAGRLAAVLLQNSGLGNAVNPLASLALVYDLPLLLVVGHRGAPGAGDAPQHRVMGAISAPLLELLGIPCATLPAGQDAAHALLERQLDVARASRRPAAVLVRPGTFAGAVGPEPPTTAPPRRGPSAAPGRVGDHRAPPPARLAALAALARALPDDALVVSTTGRTSRELFATGDRPGTFFMTGSMGCASAFAHGVALARPERPVVVVDGDGALLMKAGSLATIGHHAPGNLLHVLLDNGCYESTGGQPTAASGVDFPALAAACGYRRALAADTADALASLVAGFRAGDGPVFVALGIAGGHAEGVGRVARTPGEIRDAFAAACAAPGAASHDAGPSVPSGAARTLPGPGAPAAARSSPAGTRAGDGARPPAPPRGARP